MASPKKTSFFSHLADRQRRDTQPFEDIVMMVKLQGEQHGILRLEILDAGADRVRHLVIAETRPHSERVGPGDELCLLPRERVSGSRRQNVCVYPLGSKRCSPGHLRSVKMFTRRMLLGSGWKKESVEAARSDAPLQIDFCMIFV